jgi:hypothetical protein
VSVTEIIKPFVDAMNLGKVRIGPSQRFIFFCGGRLSEPPARPASLRDYLRRRIAGTAKIPNVNFVFAESATGLFRDSGYSDLIQFEADIAQISEIVLLIAESAGSLTELGAFAMHEWIAPRLHVLIQMEYYHAESFIRQGPLRLMLDRHNAVSFYPWKTRSDGSLKITSISSHIRNIKKDITTRLKRIPKTEEFDRTLPRHVMIAIFWCIYILRGATIKEITEILPLLNVVRTEAEIRKYLYCMRVAGWVEETQYGHTVWFYNRVDIDPFNYSFKPGAPKRDSLRWKSDIAEAIKRSHLRRPKPIVSAIGS